MTYYCIEKNCKTRAGFNYPGEKSKYCSIHKKENMVNTRNKLCIKCNKTQPNYNYIELKPLYCTDCKEDNMVDVIHEMCVDCNKVIPNFNYYGLKPKYCVSCKKKDMIDVKTKKCIRCNKIQASFNISGEKPLYCFSCKDDNMIDVRSNFCIICNKTQAYLDNRKYCSPCNAYVNPDSIQGRKYRFKQNTIVDILKQHFMFDIIDKQIDNSCTKRKPDLIIDCLTHVLNIEIDEDQHKSKSYTPECEENRYNEIFTAFADRPLICIRFNPDNYTLKENNLIWNVDGIFKNKEIDKKELDERINILVKTITKSIQEIPTEIFQIKYLFYNT